MLLAHGLRTSAGLWSERYPSHSPARWPAERGRGLPNDRLAMFAATRHPAASPQSAFPAARPAVHPFQRVATLRAYRTPALHILLIVTLLCQCLTAPVLASCPPGAGAWCVQRQAADGTMVQYPRLHWTIVASAARTSPGAAFDLRYLQGMATRVTRHVSAAALGVGGNQLSRIFFQPSGSPPLVFARFAPGSNLLRIDVLRVERGINGTITVASTQFGPHQGDRFVATQGFLSVSDQRAGKPGRNPFALWLDPGDDLFHNICFQCLTSTGTLDAYTSGVTTAIGLAMQQVGAQVGILAVAREWIDVQQQTSGGLLWSTVTVKTYGYAQPDWWIASPIGAQLGATSQLGACVVANESPCAPEHQARAGIAIAPWSGPNLPTDADLLYYSEDSHTGFTVLGYAIITAVLVGAGSYAWGGAELAGAGGLTDAALTPESTGVIAIGSSAINAGAGLIGYLGTSDVLHPGSSSNIQNGYLGETFSAGRQTALQPNNPANASLADNVQTLQIKNPLQLGLTAVRKAYMGRCSAGISRSNCAGEGSGLVPRIGDQTSK